ncbi:hypothetical protein EVAR_85618_1 [Eumeta japonica]|uniref:Uncharacterized protein n=1 Tax=Eumeta variegata TaxID=151549 RepID=A0A4C1XRX6_EUMVA|nr:hypothetical protein EVAR_85618_1 [Eumeta japonica]
MGHQGVPSLFACMENTHIQPTQVYMCAHSSRALSSSYVFGLHRSLNHAHTVRVLLMLAQRLVPYRLEDIGTLRRRKAPLTCDRSALRPATFFAIKILTVTCQHSEGGRGSFEEEVCTHELPQKGNGGNCAVIVTCQLQYLRIRPESESEAVRESEMRAGIPLRPTSISSATSTKDKEFVLCSRERSRGRGLVNIAETYLIALKNSMKREMKPTG